MVICLAITSRDQIVNMNDVYKFYGKDKGIINTECSNFYSKAKSYIDLLTENDIMNVGDVGSRVLFEKLLIFYSSVINYLLFPSPRLKMKSRYSTCSVSGRKLDSSSSRLVRNAERLGV